MNILTLALLLEQYGPRLTIKQTAKALGFSESNLRNRLSAGTISLPTYLDGGTRFVDARDVAEYLDRCRAGSRVAAADIA